MISLDYDVLCMGAGGAGVTAAVFAASQGARVALLSKDPIGYGNTRIALGAKAHTGLGEDDAVDLFVEDLIAGGE